MRKKSLAEVMHPWTSSKGELRYYINLKDILDIDIDYYKSGNVRSVMVDGDEISNNAYKKYLAPCKVWLDEMGDTHVQYCNDDWWKKYITRKVEELKKSSKFPLGKTQIMRPIAKTSKRSPPKKTVPKTAAKTAAKKQIGKTKVTRPIKKTSRKTVPKSRGKYTPIKLIKK